VLLLKKEVKKVRYKVKKDKYKGSVLQVSKFVQKKAYNT
jgi:hypothetical protein